MNTLGWAVAGTPLGLYLVLIGSLHRRRRPLVTTGWRDILALGIACCGLVIIGPMQLFFPVQASIRWPGWVWVPMLVLYFLGVILAMLWSRPRLILYGISASQFRRLLLDAAIQLDHQASWVGDVLNLPQSELQLAVEPAFSNRVHSIAWLGGYSNLADWVQLERNVVKLAKQSEASPSKAGWLLIAMGLSLLLSALVPVVLNPEVALQELKLLLLR